MNTTSKRLVRWAMAVALAVAGAYAVGCGADSGNGGDDAGAPVLAVDGAVDATSDLDAPTFRDTGPTVADGGCPVGEGCANGGQCVADGTCCPGPQACGDVCCGSGAACAFGQCATLGASCGASDDCAAGEFCLAVGDPTDGGVPPQVPDGGDAAACLRVERTQGRCVARPPACASDAGGPGCIPSCEYHPTAHLFDPVLKYAWGGDIAPPHATDVMMAPIVVELDDDDGDGKVTTADIPDIAFVSFTGGEYRKHGTLHVISVVCGQVVDKWSAPNAMLPASIAAADLDGDGRAEIVGCSDIAATAEDGGLVGNDGGTPGSGHPIAFHGDGRFFWLQTGAACDLLSAPAIADLNGDGAPEVIFEDAIMAGSTGAIETRLLHPTRIPIVADLDQDGQMDVTSGYYAFHADGGLLWNLGAAREADGGPLTDPGGQPTVISPGGFAAVGDFDHDSKPEVAYVDSNHHALAIAHYDPSAAGNVAVLRHGVDLNTGAGANPSCTRTSGGGPPVIADFNGDGVPDVGAAGAVAYFAADGAKLMSPGVPNANTALWSRPTRDCSSAITGSTVFDFNGDGKAEVIYNDEPHLHMYSGVDGTDLIPPTCNTTGTIVEYPIVADVDNDGQAEIVVAANAYAIGCQEADAGASGYSGIRIFASASNSWVKTRRVWNEHTYHVTNVSETGIVPAKEPANWLDPSLDNFRQNKQPGGEFAAPDATIAIQFACAVDGTSTGTSMIVTVSNVGEDVLIPGVTARVFEAPNGPLYRAFVTSSTLAPFQSQRFSVPVDGATPASVYATVELPPQVHECRAENDRSASVTTQRTCALR